MAVRAWLNQNPAVATAVAMAAMLIAVGVLFWTSNPGGPGGQSGAYYYDLEADRLFVAESGPPPPVEHPEGEGQGVLAHIYACGECPADLEGLNQSEIEAQGAFIAWFERYPDEARELINRVRYPEPGQEPATTEEALRVEDLDGMAQVIRRPDDDRWIGVVGERAMRIMEEGPQAACAGEPAVRCVPQ